MCDVPLLLVLANGEVTVVRSQDTFQTFTTSPIVPRQEKGHSTRLPLQLYALVIELEHSQYISRPH